MYPADSQPDVSRDRDKLSGDSYVSTHASLTALPRTRKKMGGKNSPGRCHRMSLSARLLPSHTLIFYVALKCTSQAILALLCFFLPKYNTGPYSSSRGIFHFHFRGFFTLRPIGPCVVTIPGYPSILYIPLPPPSLSLLASRQAEETVHGHSSCLVDLSTREFPVSYRNGAA